MQLRVVGQWLEQCLLISNSGVTHNAITLFAWTPSYHRESQSDFQILKL